ncbi:endoplasmic reticulum junction formation protein lunapark-A-like [Drosophila kikkawai]|uniref:Endoplasmic reticulum junction formation protein lunapark n=1 Tax=Drosophila kikkawai TaxID=30033 RepID=A0A6P4J1P5_DROKI|nr:endoplasmic reticulum junction formation protein lunapark-B-like [Drosophila kikkawai]
MGFVLSKFLKKNTTHAVLEELQKRIQALEKYMIDTEERKRRFVTNFVGFTVGAYIVGFGLIYYFYCPSTVLEGIVYLVPLLLIPVVIILLRCLLTWYFQLKLNENGEKLAKLKEDKRILLDQVKSKEIYRVALNILERFDEKEEIRLQTAAAFERVQEQQEQVLAVEVLHRRRPFPIVDDRTRSAFDRFVDFIVGDGPRNRFGMICKECYAHNGMVPREEYEYASFRCASCDVLNRARKMRPVAPLLQMEVSTEGNESSESESAMQQS